MDLTTECGHLLSQVTRQNIGKIAHFSYRGQFNVICNYHFRIGKQFQDFIKRKFESSAYADA